LGANHLSVLRQAAVPLALVAAGAAVVAITGGSTAGTAVALALIGLAGVVAVSLVFFAVGRSEDAARAASRPPEPEPGRDGERGGDGREVHGAGNGRSVSPARARRRPLPPRRPE
jgi:hypothetical protein